MRRKHLLAALALITLTIALCSERAGAHKPITSPYTYNEDVFPVLREHCGRCHVAGGIAPMTLMTHEETVPWGESIRAELLGGHMPPWSVVRSPGKFRNVEGLTARELNVLLTWVTGGTPPGAGDKPAAPDTSERGWQLGKPDVVLQLPSTHTLPAGTQEDVAEFTIQAGTNEPRWIRAVDLMPGTASVVRSATVTLKQGAGEDGDETERTLSLWLPGDTPVALDEGAGFRLPARAELTVRVRYKKTWQYEQVAVSDRSSIGIYFAAPPATDVHALALVPPQGAAATTDAGRLTFARTIDTDVRALAIYPDPALGNADVTVTAVRPNGSREELIAFRPQPSWARRYWFAQPIGLPRGTRIEVVVAANDALLPPGALPPPAAPLDPSKVRLVLNVVPVS